MYPTLKLPQGTSTSPFSHLFTSEGIEGWGDYFLLTFIREIIIKTRFRWSSVAKMCSRRIITTTRTRFTALTSEVERGLSVWGYTCGVFEVWGNIVFYLALATKKNSYSFTGHSGVSNMPQGWSIHSCVFHARSPRKTPKKTGEDKLRIVYYARSRGNHPLSEEFWTLG